MASGGARAKSGPPRDPKSGRSERAGYSLTSLPASGFDGDAPSWSMPRRLVYVVVDKVRELDVEATARVAEREDELWKWAWSTPQACAWSMPSESWRIPSVAMWVRTFVLCESSEATAADKNSLHRFAEDIGLTPAGLSRNGWEIKADELAEKRAGTPSPAAKRERRLRSS